MLKKEKKNIFKNFSRAIELLSLSCLLNLSGQGAQRRGRWSEIELLSKNGREDGVEVIPVMRLSPGVWLYRLLNLETLPYLNLYLLLFSLGLRSFFLSLAFIFLVFPFVFSLLLLWHSISTEPGALRNR